MLRLCVNDQVVAAIDWVIVDVDPGELPAYTAYEAYDADDANDDDTALEANDDDMEFTANDDEIAFEANDDDIEFVANDDEIALKANDAVFAFKACDAEVAFIANDDDSTEPDCATVMLKVELSPLTNVIVEILTDAVTIAFGVFDAVDAIPLNEPVNDPVTYVACVKSTNDDDTSNEPVIMADPENGKPTPSPDPEMYDAVNALVAYDAVPNSDPVIPLVTFKEPVIKTEPVN